MSFTTPSLFLECPASLNPAPKPLFSMPIMVVPGGPPDTILFADLEAMWARIRRDERDRVLLLTPGTYLTGITAVST